MDSSKYSRGTVASVASRSNNTMANAPRVLHAPVLLPRVYGENSTINPHAGPRISTPSFIASDISFGDYPSQATSRVAAPVVFNTDSKMENLSLPNGARVRLLTPAVQIENAKSTAPQQPVSASSPVSLKIDTTVAKPSHKTRGSIGSPSGLMFGSTNPTPYSLSLNPLRILQVEFAKIEDTPDNAYRREQMYHCVYNGWNAWVELNNRIFNERTRCRLCGQVPRTEHSFREMNHAFSRKADAICKDLQRRLREQNPLEVTLDDMEKFYELYWEAERTFWEDDASHLCGAASWTGSRA